MLGEIIWDQNSIAVVCVMAVPILVMFSLAWVQVERRKSDNALKQSMVERGMSAEDIERVIAAKGPKS
jgi:hypothetical protein